MEMVLVWDCAEQNMLQRYMWKEELCQCNQFWMNELEKLAQWKRFAGMMQMEWDDNAWKSGCLSGRMWDNLALRQRNAVVSAVVM